MLCWSSVGASPSGLPFVQRKPDGAFLKKHRDLSLDSKTSVSIKSKLLNVVTFKEISLHNYTVIGGARYGRAYHLILIYIGISSVMIGKKGLKTYDLVLENEMLALATASYIYACRYGLRISCFGDPCVTQSSGLGIITPLRPLRCVSGPATKSPHYFTGRTWTQHLFGSPLNAKRK